MDSGLDSGLSSLGWSHGRGHCVVSCKTLNSHSASLHPSVEMGNSKFKVGG